MKCLLSHKTVLEALDYIQKDDERTLKEHLEMGHL